MTLHDTGESGEGLHRLIRWIVLVVLIVVSLFPFAWLVITALRPSAEFFNPPVALFPAALSLDSIQRLGGLSNAPRAVAVSVLISIVTATIATGLSLLVGVAISYGRVGVAGRREVLNVLLGTRILPPVVTCAGFFALFDRAHLIDTWPALVLANSIPCIAIGTVLLIPGLRAIPASFMEQARVEGARAITMVARHVVLPEIGKDLLVVWMLCFAATWNEFLLASLLTETSRGRTLSVLIATGVGQFRVDFGVLALAGVLSLVPALVTAPVLVGTLFKRARRYAAQPRGTS